MKIYEKVVIDIITGVVEEEISYDYEGPVDLLWGPGSSSGEVTYPSYIVSAFCKLWGIVGDTSNEIDVQLVDVLNAMMTSDGGNPFDGESAFDPNAALSLVAGSPLKEMQSIHDSYESVVTALSHTVDWEAISNKAVSEVADMVDEEDITSAIATIVSTALTNSGSLITAAISSATSALGSSAITGAVTAYESEIEGQHLRSIGRLAASMADNVNSSAFVFAIAQAEYEFNKNIDSFRTKLKLDTYSNSLQSFVQAYIDKIRVHADAYIRNHLTYEQYRATMINSAIDSMANMLNHKINSYKDVAMLQAEISRLSIVAKKEQTDRDLEIDTNYAKWDLGVVIQASNVLASIAGGTAGPSIPQPSQAASTIGGALSGGATGAMIGSAGGPMGTAIGASIGMIAGGIAGYLQ